MFNKEIWNKFIVHFFEILKSPARNERDFKISKNERGFLINHMWQARKEHTRVRINQQQNVLVHLSFLKPLIKAIQNKIQNEKLWKIQIEEAATRGHQAWSLQLY